MIRVAVMISVSLLFTGCITPRLAHNNLPGLEPTKAFVFFSTGAEYTSLSFHTGVDVINVDTRKKHPIALINASIQRSHFQDAYGHVQSVFLDEGTYHLVPHAGNIYQCMGSRPLYKFSVKRGEFVYLGSFLLTSDDRLLYSPSAHRDRDTEYLLQRNPALSAIQITVPPVEHSQDERGEC
jgi:hypothetical protein